MIVAEKPRTYHGTTLKELRVPECDCALCQQARTLRAARRAAREVPFSPDVTDYCEFRLITSRRGGLVRLSAELGFKCGEILDAVRAARLANRGAR